MKIILEENAKIALEKERANYIRIFCKGDSCVGKLLGLGIGRKQENDEMITVSGINFIVDEQVKSVNEDILIDFTEKQFVCKFKNTELPNCKNCGKKELVK